jgi:predicted transcriptional regulator
MRREKVSAFDLKAARETRKLSQAEVAAILCTTQASVSRWESSGELPAVYRKTWDQHWKLEDLSNGEVDRPAVKRLAGSARRSNKVGVSKKGNKRSNKRTRSRTQKSDTDMPVSDSVQLIQRKE